MIGTLAGLFTAWGSLASFLLRITGGLLNSPRHSSALACSAVSTLAGVSVRVCFYPGIPLPHNTNLVGGAILAWGIST